MENDIVVNNVETVDKEPKRQKARARKKKCRVVSYNKYSGVIVYEDSKGRLVQTNAIEYDGSGYVTV